MTSRDHSGHDQNDRDCPELLGFASFELHPTIRGTVTRLVTSDLQAAGSNGQPIRPCTVLPLRRRGDEATIRGPDPATRPRRPRPPATRTSTLRVT